MSRLVPQLVICCATSALRDHTGLGYQKAKFRVIPNGFDLDKFRPDPVARNEIRRALAVPEDSPIIGYVARFDPLKNHRLFFEAAGILRRRRADVRFVLVGDGMDPENAQLQEWIREAGTSDVTTLIGKRDDIARLNAAFDIATLCSTTEGFPNVLGEALACAVPCVTTDVGEAAVIVGTAGRVVPSGDAGALANAWDELLLMMPSDRRRLGCEGRKQIEARFSLDIVVEQYAAVYAEMAADVPKDGCKRM
jgi:glycosyltransferase involved in cell wall biosynthesis